MSERVDHHRYMASREWALKKQAVKERSTGWCERCKIAPHQNTHHLTYQRLGNEDLDDLQGVCRDCHEYLSGRRDDDPARLAVIEGMETNGLWPVYHEGRFVMWHVMNDRSPTAEFFLTLRTHNADDPTYPAAVIVDLGDGVWAHYHCYDH